MVSDDPGVHEKILREVLLRTAEINLDGSPPMLGQLIHRRLREVSGAEDPYKEAKDHLNRMALSLMPGMKKGVEAAPDPLLMASRLAIAGNMIDMGFSGEISEAEVREAIARVMKEPFAGEIDGFRKSLQAARNILYLADNAGEIVFDRLLIEEIGPERITLAVRGGPVINDVTRVDARAAGLDKIVRIIDNGSDAPGTLLNDCSEEFMKMFNGVDLIIAKGQGNYESLCGESGNIYFLFKVKCQVIADHTGFPVGTHMLWRSGKTRASATVS